jgi:predicted nucleotidyltransferase
MLLFGSRARGEASRGSDYDVAVLLKGGSRPANVRTLLSDTAYRHVRAGVPIRPLAVMVQDVSENGRYPVTRNIARDGIVIRSVAKRPVIGGLRPGKNRLRPAPPQLFL